MCYTVWEPLFENQAKMNMRNHEQTTPIVQDAILIYQHGGQDERLQVGTPAWYDWLNTARTFAVRRSPGALLGSARISQ